LKKISLSLVLTLPIFGFSQSVIANINSGAISDNNFMHSVGEIYVVPTDPNDVNSGTIGMLYQTVLQVLGINELEKESIKVYPNPTSDYVYIKLKSNSKIEQVEIYDLSGKIVKQINIKEDKIDLSFLEKGIYILKLKNSDIQPIKIIKK
jgi:hypothetical protein